MEKQSKRRRIEGMGHDELFHFKWELEHCNYRVQEVRRQHICSGVVESLHTFKPCTSCGLRVPPAKLAAHMDQHFRKNTTPQTCRGWWVDQTAAKEEGKQPFKLGDGEERQEERQEERLEERLEYSLQHGDPPHCAYCHEELNVTFDQDEDMWLFEAGVNVKCETVYHIVCAF